jgi:hypothetical protein
MISAAALTETPIRERMDMMLMKFFFRVDSKYLRAIKNSRLTKVEA